MKTFPGIKITIEHDQDCTSPLEYDEGVTITYKAGSRYILGNAPVDQEEFERVAAEVDAGRLIGLPVYAYIHSGVALSTGSFGCPWDSGQSGYIYIDKKTALEWQGGKVLTAKKRAACVKSLRTVVSEFSKWLNGECYGFIIEDENGEHLDSCWGFIGYEYAQQEAESAAEHCAAQLREDKRATWRQALTEARERKHWLQRGIITV